mgnify:CR=1 FL=1
MLPYLLILLAFLADQLSKQWAIAFLSENGVTRVHPLLTIHETYNEGLISGLFQGIGPLVGWLTILVVVGMFVYLTRVPREQWLIRAGLALLIGGSLGNMVDRITTGRVLDFLETPLRPGIFNLADTFIYLGIILIFGGVLLINLQILASKRRLE